MSALKRQIGKFRWATRPIFLLGLPVVITSYGAVLMQITDAWMLGKLGSQELAAVTPAGLMVSLILVFGGEALTAVNAFVSTAVGKERYVETGKFGWQGIYLALCIGILALSLLPLAPWLFFTFFSSVDPRVLELQVMYFQISLLGVLPLTVSAALGNFFIGCYMPKTPMFVALAAVLFNAVLSYCLIFGGRILGWEIRAMGFAGAAWGTVVASYLQMLLLFGIFFFRRALRGLGTHRWKFCRRRFRRVLAVGLPAGCQGFLDLLSWGVLLSWLVSHFDYQHLAAQTILTTCIRLSFLPADGMASSLTTLVGFAQGERNFLLAKRLTRTGFQLIATYMCCLALLYYFCREGIMRFFTNDPDVIAIGSQCMVFVAAFQFFDAMNVTYINALQGAGDTRWPTMIQLTLSGLILMGGGLLVVHVWPQFQSAGIWLVAALYVFFQGLAFRWRWLGGGWRRIKLLG